MLAALRRASAAGKSSSAEQSSLRPILEGPLVVMEFASGGKEVKWCVASKAWPARTKQQWS